MSLQERKLEFVTRIWGHVVPTSEISKFFLTDWIPERFLEPFGKSVTRKQVQSINLTEPEITSVCFEFIQNNVRTNWSRLPAELAAFLVGALDELALWDFFEKDLMKASASIRFDLADIVFQSKRKDLYDELRALSINIDRMEITKNNSLENERKVVEAVLRHVIVRAQIDLAFVTIQNVQRSSAVLERIAARFERTATDYYTLLQDIFKRSTWWTTPDGQIYIDSDEVPTYYLPEIYRKLKLKLAPFDARIKSFVQSLDAELPPEA